MYKRQVGRNASAAGQTAIAMGVNSTASQYSDIAIGELATSSGGYSLAMGHKANASGGISIALGTSSIANSASSVALGSYSEAGSNTFDSTSSGAVFKNDAGVNTTVSFAEMCIRDRDNLMSSSWLPVLEWNMVKIWLST